MPKWKDSKRLPRSRTEKLNAADWCLKIVDWGIAAIILVAPLFFGGRHLLGRFVFITLACVVGIAWLTHQALSSHGRWTPTVAHVFGLASIGLVAFQLIPLPPEWTAWLSPRNQSLLPLWDSSAKPGVALGHWPSLSLTPQNTQLALATLIAYYLLFTTAIQRLQTLDDIQRLLKIIATSALLMGSFGLLQYATSNGRFFWFYEYPYTTTDFPVKGSFTCRNHFAHFLALGIGPLAATIVLTKASKSRKSSWSRQSAITAPLFTYQNALSLGCVLIAIAVLMTLSRGGAMASAIAATVVAFLYLRKGLLSGGHIYGIALMGLVVIGLLSFGNYDKIASRLDDFKSGSVDELDAKSGRRRIWNANYAAIQQGGFFGAGAGSHREIYPAYLNDSFWKEYTHAENSYLQLVTENGWLGLGLLCTIACCVVIWCWRAVATSAGKQHAALAGAVTAGLAASLAHAAVDFVWFIPACLSLALLLAACALRLAQIGTFGEKSHARSKYTWPRSRWIAIASLAVLASIYAITIASRPANASLSWDRYLLASSLSKQETRKELKELKEPKSDSERLQAQQIFNEMLTLQLKDTVSRNPNFARANARLASLYLRLFASNQQDSSNAMPIEQIRDAAIASRFESSQQLRQWLSKAFGDNSANLYRAHFHARRAIQLSPMQGEAYLILAKLCFLEGKANDGVKAYIQQGLLLRPHSGRVLFESGWQYLQLGEVARTLELWKAVYLQPEPRRLKIVQILAGSMSAQQFIDTFQPDWHTLPFVWKRYRETGSINDWQTILRYGLAAAHREQADHSSFGAGRLWLGLSKMQAEIGQLDQSLASLAIAQEFAQDDYAIRRALGRTLLQTGRLQEAQTHLRWCLSRKPDDPRLRGELVKATKQTYQPQMAKSLNSSSSLE